MPPSAVGTNRSAGQAIVHCLVVHPRQASPSTVMCARSCTSNCAVAMRSSKDITGHRSDGSPIALSSLRWLIAFRSLRSLIAFRSRPLGPLARSSEPLQRGPAIVGEVAQLDAGPLALIGQDPPQARLRRRVVDPEHALD